MDETWSLSVHSVFPVFCQLCDDTLWIRGRKTDRGRKNERRGRGGIRFVQHLGGALPGKQERESRRSQVPHVASDGGASDGSVYRRGRGGDRVSGVLDQGEVWWG